MSLLKPTHGELLDRLTIVAHKLVRLDIFGKVAWSSTHDRLKAEVDELAHLTDRNSSEVRVIVLAAINAAIWEREDMARALAGKCDPGFYAALTAGTRKLADRRQRIILLIDGKTEKESEKSWMWVEGGTVQVHPAGVGRTDGGAE